jgi:hypothetical protein
METTSSPHIAIRLATADDRSALIRLAALDSAAAPVGKALVATRDGEILAAHPLGGRRPIAHPFQRTAEVSELLALRASQLA